MNYQVKTLLVCAMLGVVPAALVAQGGRKNQVQQPQRGRQMPNDQRLGQALKTQLNLTDAQATRLQDVLARFNQRRATLNQDERQSRMTIRESLCGGDTTRSADVSKALDQVIDVEKRRVQMLDEEQHELSAFLTPYQRARYMGFVEQLGTAMGGRGAGGRAGRQGQPPDGPPPDGPPNGPPARGLAGRGDVCANPPLPNGAAGRRGRGGDGQIPPSI